jgi:hypothetical protein
VVVKPNRSDLRPLKAREVVTNEGTDKGTHGP